VLLAAREVIDHLAADPDVLRGSRLLKGVVESFCRPAGDLDLPELAPTGAAPKPPRRGQLRVRSSEG
jgi:hypothetical protein